MADIFKLVGSIFVDTDKANDSLKKTDEKASSVGDTLAKVGKGAAAVGTAVVAGATAAVGGMVATAKETASTADTIDKASKRMGVDAEYYQKLEYAAGLSGVEMSTLEKAAKKLEGTDINLDDAIANIMTLGTAEERTAAAADLFGESVAYNLEPMLQQTTGEFMNTMNAAEDLGLVMSDDAVSSGAALNDTLSTLEQTSSMLMTNVGTALMPVVQEFADKLIEYMPQIQSWLDLLTPILTEMFDYLMPIIFDLADSLMPIIFDLLQQLMPVFQEIMELILPIIVELMQTLAPIFVQLCEQLLPVILNILTALLPVLNPIMQLLSPILNLLMAILSPLLELINKLLPPLINLFVKVISKALQPLINNLPKVTAGFNKMVSGIKNAMTQLKTAVKTPINAILGFINGLIRGVTGGVNNIIRALNRFQVNVPQWVTNLTGVSNFGFNLAEVSAAQIPLLAKGGQIEGEGSAVVGEAGAELVEMPKGARVTPLNSNNNEFTEVKELLEEMCGYFRKGFGVYLNGNAVVGQLAPAMDTALGRLSTNSGRRV